MIANVLAGLVAPKSPGARCRVPVDENTRAEEALPMSAGRRHAPAEHSAPRRPT